MSEYSGTDISDDIVERLAEIDRRGLICPPGADPGVFLAVAEKTLSWAEGVGDELRSAGKAEVMGEEFAAEQSIPADILCACMKQAAGRYGICPSWAPAFFSARHLPWYVGGACFYSVEDEQTRHICLVLSSRFRSRRKWLLYSREEIVSHEICHVARAMMEQRVFEEPLAYRISESRLRRGLGPVFRGAWEAAAILAGSTLLFLGSVAGTFFALRWIQYPAAAPLLVACSFLGIRAVKANRKLGRAIRNLSEIYGNNAEAVAFRCTDDEIYELAERANAAETIETYLCSSARAVRWAVINRRFKEKGDT